MEAMEAITNSVLSLLATLLIALMGQLYRQRRMLGVADTDPLQYALQRLLEKFEASSDSVYLISVTSKLINELFSLIMILMGNGSDRVASELLDITTELKIRVMFANTIVDQKKKHSPAELKVLEELQMVLQRSLSEWRKKKSRATT